jgi:hypothetical protein
MYWWWAGGPVGPVGGDTESKTAVFAGKGTISREYGYSGPRNLINKPKFMTGTGMYWNNKTGLTGVKDVTKRSKPRDWHYPYKRGRGSREKYNYIVLLRTGFTTYRLNWIQNNSQHHNEHAVGTRMNCYEERHLNSSKRANLLSCHIKEEADTESVLSVILTEVQAAAGRHGQQPEVNDD